MFENLPKTRKEAKAADSSFYYTGRACRNGHISKRYTEAAHCCMCDKEWKNNNKERVSQAKKAYRERNPEKVKESNRKWQNKTEQRRQWNLDNPELRKEIGRRYYHKNKSNPLFRLNKNTRKSVWESLKKSKEGRHWEFLVGFTLGELKRHLELRFADGMSWENYGSYWEVDHVKPLACCASFGEAWNLGNLQPLTKYDNRSKGDKYNI